MNQRSAALTIILLFGLASIPASVTAQDFPSDLLTNVPQAAQKLLSDDVADRVSVLNDLVIEVPGSCTGLHSFPFELKRSDYVFIVGKILEKDLETLGEKSAAETWHKLASLIRHFELKEFIPSVSKYLRSESWQTQAAALALLDAFRAKDFDDEVATLLSGSNEYVRREALEVLVRFGSKKAVPELVTQLSSPDVNQRYAALSRLVTVDGRDAAPQVAKLIRDDDPNNRHWALDVLVKFNAKANAQEVWFLTSGHAPQTETYALAALVFFGDTKAIPIVTERIATSGERANGLLSKLVEINAKAIIPSLIGLLENPRPTTSLDSQRSLILALGQFGAKESSPTLRRYLSANPFVSRAAIQVLGEFEEKAAVDDLLNIFFKYLPKPPDAISNDTYLSAEAAVALAKIGDRKAWNVLIDAAENPKYPYRSQVIQELNKHINPSLWKRVESVKVAGQDFGSIKVNAEAFSIETKIPISLEYDPERHFFRFRTPGEYPSLRVVPAETLQTALKNIVSVIDSGTLPNRFTYILDGESIRILTVESAVQWWRTRILKTQSTN